MLVVSAGEFVRVYDPSEGEAQAWYVNDHTFVRDRPGSWHLIGITHPEPATPYDELHLAHATASALFGPRTKQPFRTIGRLRVGRDQLWAPHVIFWDDLCWMLVCRGGRSKEEYRIQLATSEDWVMYYTATSRPEGGPFVVVATESSVLIHWQ